jgi:3-methyladenine DNA glycosylase AlkC
MTSDAPLLKDVFFPTNFFEQLAAEVAALYPSFDRASFLACATGGGFEEMALKEKMRHATKCLHAFLPDDYAQALDLLLKVAPQFPGFDGMVFSDFVALYGLHDWQHSLPALREFTRTISAEFAIRPFINQDPERALPYLYEWAADPDPAVRRLASEGSRSRLPWAEAIPAFKADPTPILPILEKLKGDPAEDVRRSVANNLNDISKDNPQVVLDLAESWYGETGDVDWVVKHACRTLLKRGDMRAMRLFGFADPAQVQVSSLTFRPAELSIGEDLLFSYELDVQTAEPRLLRLEYAVNFVRSKGKSSRKVFHQREFEFAPGLHTISKKHSFRDLSTRTHYPGEHLFEIIVNGVVKKQGSVRLL